MYKDSINVTDELLSEAYTEQLPEDDWVSAILGDVDDTLEQMWGDKM